MPEKLDDHLALASGYALVFCLDQARDLIPRINRILPLGSNWRHLKRIRKCQNNLQMFLGGCHEWACRQDLIDYLIANKVQADAIIEVSVPAAPISDRAAWIESQKHSWSSVLCLEDVHLKRVIVEETGRLLGLEFPLQRVCIFDPRDELAFELPFYPCQVGCTGDDPFAQGRHPVLSLAQMYSKAVTAPERSNDKVDYLCTGCTVWIPQEPCLVCCMALTHSRIRAAVIGSTMRQGDDNDGPWSRWMLHRMPQINHHYLVFLADNKEAVS